MNRQKLFRHIIEYFSQVMPAPQTELIYHSPYELLVAVILSAQCTDKRVNLITPAFFKRFPDPQTLARASEKEVLELIGSCSYPAAKTRHLLGMAKMLCDKFDGHIPSNRDDLMRLPGVGRKTSHVICSVVFRQPTLAVDTHVLRVSKRIGLVPADATTLLTEKILTRHFPASKIPDAHHWLILHGRYTCKARKPLCSNCGIRNVCRYYKQTHSRKKQN